MLGLPFDESSSFGPTRQVETLEKLSAVYLWQVPFLKAPFLKATDFARCLLPTVCQSCAVTWTQRFRVSRALESSFEGLALGLESQARQTSRP